MSKLPLLLMLCVVCTLERSFANNFYYYPSSAGALNYQYAPYVSPYVYSAYAVPVDCDKSTTEGSSTEGGSSEGGEGGSSESTEGGESKEESSSEGGSSEESSKEGGGEEGGSKEEGGEKKEEGSGEEKKEVGEKKEEKKKVAKYVFPPVSYPYLPQTGQQIVYSAPSYPYMPYKAYSVVQQPASYSLKSSGYGSSGYGSSGYSSYPYYSLSSIPAVSAGYSSPLAKVVSYPGVSKTITFGPASGVGGPAGYWNGNVGYYRV